MKRNWYAAAILLVLCLLLYLAGRYVTDTTDAMQAGVQRAYALAEQGDYPAARAAYAQTTRRAERDSALSGKLGMLPGVSTKTIYGKTT